MSNSYKNKKGFTLLEIIIVIIIIGILASLALPRYTRTIEYARGMEGLMQLGILRQSLNRYYVPTNSYEGATLDRLDVENPNTDPRRHFDYVLTGAPLPVGSTVFSITATRNTTDNTNPPTPGAMTIDQNGVKTGTNSYAGIR